MQFIGLIVFLNQHKIKTKIVIITFVLYNTIFQKSNIENEKNN
jgi:hypothetical protein